MGVQIVVQVLDHTPADLTATERLVLVALAERCRDDTRRVLPRSDETVRAMLMRRCGLGESGLTKVLGRLADRGVDGKPLRPGEPSLDVRVPLGRDGRGRAVYAYEGRASEFVVPLLSEGGPGGSLSPESPDDRAGTPQSEGGAEGRLDRTRGQALEPERVDERAGLSLSPSEIPQQRARELDGLTSEQQVVAQGLGDRLAASVTLADAADCVRAIATRRTPVDNVGAYVRNFAADDVRTHADRYRAKISRSTPATTAKPGQRSSGPRCSHDYRLGADGSFTCPPELHIEHEGARVAEAVPA